MFSWWLLAAALLLTACTGSGDRRAAADTAVAGPVEQAAPTQSGATIASAHPPEAPNEVPRLVLEPDGLGLVIDLGIVRPLSFGATRESVLAGVATALGDPEQQGRQEECPAGPIQSARYRAGLLVAFQKGAFVGWSVQRHSKLRTVAGIGPSWTLAEVRAAYGEVTVERTSLGAEFAAGDLHGVAADTSNRAEVEVLFAGTNCIFR